MTFDPNQERDEQGRWSAGGGAQYSEALRLYAGPGYYRPINQGLRKGALDSKYAEIVSQLDAAMAPTTKSSVVWRGGPRLSGLRSGAVISDKGFTSTSTNEKAARWFADGALYRIEVPKGTPAIDLGHAIAPGLGDEVLLGRGGRYEILNVGAKEHRGDRTFNVVSMRRLPDALPVVSSRRVKKL